LSRPKLHLMFTGLGAGNTGDEAMFLAFLNYYRLPPGSTVEVYNPSSPVIKTFPCEYRYLDWKEDQKSNEALESAQAALMVGGTPVACEWGLKWPMQGLARRLNFCHLKGIPVHAVGVGVDALYGRDARKIFFGAFWPVKTWTVRSQKCRSALLNLGVSDKRIMVGSDLAWLFSPKQENKKWAAGFWKGTGIDISRPLIGVNVVNERWAGRTETKGVIAEALDLLARKMKIQTAFLCNESREGDYFDFSAAKEVVRMMQTDAVIVPNRYFTPSQMVALLGFCTLTLSQRYHFTLFSILAGAVSLSFARGQKMISLLEELGEEPVGIMENCNAEFLYERISSALINRYAIESRQQLAARHLTLRARGNFQFVESLTPKIMPSLRLASVSELESASFTGFMEMLNYRGASWGLRQFTDWSKVWEYPWLWFNGLAHINWAEVKLLDMGSELSPMPWFLAFLGAQVTLVERDGQWIPTWERLLKETGLSVDWNLVPDERLPFPDWNFDVVTSFSVIEHVNDKVLAVDEVARVMKPGGIFAISFDICEPDMGMSFPEWNGSALTMKEFEELIWENSAFDNGGQTPEWNIEDCARFKEWNLRAAPYHNYVAGAAILKKANTLKEI